MKKVKGVVSAASPEAARAGAEVLREGGNAVDAAVAVSFALGVTEPAGSGIGGQGTFIIQKPFHVPFVINGTSFAPAKLPDDVHPADLKDSRASTVPSLVRTLDFVHRNYGSGGISWKRLLEPAVAYARDGYRMGEFRQKSLRRYRKALTMRATGDPPLLKKNGSVPEVGALMKNELQARTLERIGEKGARDFYQGEIASEIVRDITKNDGWITEDDLKNLREPKILQALKSSYRNWDVASLPPPASGWAVLMALNILEQVPSEIMGKESPRRLSWMAQALKIIHRHRLLRPIQNLIDYEDLVYRKINKLRAKGIAGSLREEGTGETTHFSVADGKGMVAGVTQSLNSYYGSKVMHPTLGFFYNDYMIEFVAASRNNPYAMKAGAMPYSSMSASIISKESKPALVLGSPANERIVSSVIQVISHWVDLQQGIVQAVAVPRIHTINNEELMMEGDRDAQSLLALEELGFSMYSPRTSLFAGDLNPYFGGVHAVALENGEWTGAADPRRDGAVVFAD